MASTWEPPDRDMAEIEVEALPGDRRVVPRRHLGSAVASSVDAARRAARALRIVAWLVAATGVVGYVLTTFWTDEAGMPGMSVRQRIGGLLAFSWVPLALAALVYATSFVLVLYAARLELDAGRREESRTR